MAAPAEQFERFRRAGDARALGAVFDAVAPELLLVAVHVAPAGVEPEDLVQATFVDAIENARSWDARRPLVPWLIGILVNHARHERRRGGRAVDPARVPSIAARDPADEAGQREVAEHIAEALHGLPRHYRQVLTLRLVHGLTPSQIAVALECPVASVKTRLQRGLGHLRRALPAGIAVSLAAVVVAGKGLAAARTAVLAHAQAAGVLAAAGTGVAAAVTGGIVMNKTVLVAAGALVAVAAAFAWPLVTAADPAPVAVPEPPAATAAAAASAEVDVPAVADPGRDAVAPAPAANPASPPRVHGLVVDELGNPLAGIEVVLGRASPQSAFESEARFVLERSGGYTLRGRGTARTRDDGRFEFDAELREEPAVVAAWHPARGGVLQAVPGDLEEPVTLVLPDHGQLVGRVLDERGVGVADVRVHVYPARSGMPSSVPVTDAAGAFTSAPLPPGPYRVNAWTDRHEERSVHADLADGRDTAVELSLPALPVLDAVLVDGGDRPWTASRLAAVCGVDAAEIEAIVTDLSTTSLGSADRSSVEPTPLAFDATTGGVQAPVRARRAHFVSVWWRGARLGEAPLPSAEVARIPIELAPVASTEVRVRIAFEGDAGAAIPVAARIGRPDDDMGSALATEAEVTTTTREAVLSVPAHPVPSLRWVVVEADGYASHEQPLVLPAGAAAVVHDVTLSRSARPLAGVVVDGEGQPVEGQVVCVVGADGAMLRRPGRCRAWTDRHGEFRFDALPHVPLRVLVRGEERGSAVVDVAAADEEPVRVRLTAGRLVRMALPDFSSGVQYRVLDAAGRPLLDDRVGGAVRFGGSELWLRSDAAVVEAWLPAAPAAWARGVVEAAGVVRLAEVEDR